MAASTVPVFKGALLDLLQSEDALRNVVVSWGWPHSPAREMVILGDVADSEQSWLGLGNRSKEERYTLEVYARVEVAGSDQRPATTRAYALASVIEEAVKDDITVEGSVGQVSFAGANLEETVSEGDQSRISVVVCKLAVIARLPR